MDILLPVLLDRDAVVQVRMAGHPGQRWGVCLVGRLGVARKGNAEELRRHGAHLVVNDLGELVH